MDATANTYTVLRGLLSSPVGSHNANEAVLHLDTSFIVAPFAPKFFLNRASINYMHTVSLPDVRVSAAEFFVTNAFGDSQTNQVCYTNRPDQGLRTLSGGQFSMQLSGYLATQQNAAPPLLVEASHAVRDVRATVSQAAIGYAISIDILQDGVQYCNLVIAPGKTASGLAPINSVYPAPAPFDGLALPPLKEGATLTTNVTLQVDGSGTGQLSPGRDLTVTIRL
jgi:hypothetical protein